MFREAEERMRKQKAMQEFIIEFREKREEWKKKEQQEMDEENRRIMEFANVQQKREEERIKRRHQRSEKMTEVQAAVHFTSILCQTYLKTKL